ncbi:endolytic transglycosylase MltG [uncultured Moraxella sp.]|uniref:endolytic transglycosylase MltG n=1 Tax=uncultured Moraxella sp. TaxID=263769 RepID=UPI0025D16055|nr:endolytic transglycosylase MltG [uncultured Moraxella sp.]
MAKSPNTSKSAKSRQAKQSKRSAKSIFIAIIAVLLLGVLVLYQTIFASSQHPEMNLSVKKGDTYYSLLANESWSGAALSLSPVAKAYLALMANKPLQEGEYTIPSGASLATALGILQQGGKTEQVTIRIIEGKTVKDLYHAIKTTDGVKLELLTPPADGYAWTDVARDNEAVAKALGIESPNGNLEGWFAPNTYHFNKGVSDKAILQKLYDDQKRILDDAWQSRDQNLPYQTPYEALIMASIIEKETGIKSERTLVSSVFVNRLRQGMRLQTDPTIIYGLFDRYDGKIYRSNINEKTAYNTYQIDGLPPTPIALPSAEAIRATMHPDASDVLYFVATGNGGHKFSKTLDEHNKAVAEYRAVMAQKEGSQ